MRMRIAQLLFIFLFFGGSMRSILLGGNYALIRHLCHIAFSHLNYLQLGRDGAWLAGADPLSAPCHIHGLCLLVWHLAVQIGHDSTVSTVRDLFLFGLRFECPRHGMALQVTV